MSKKKIRVLIADDHEMVRSGLVSMLAGTEMEVVAGAASGEEAIKLTARHHPDVVMSRHSHAQWRWPDGPQPHQGGASRTRHPDSLHVR